MRPGAPLNDSLRPSRREALHASLLAGAVVAAGSIAAAVTVAGAPAPTYAEDAPFVASLLLTPADVPGGTAVAHRVYRPSQVAGNAALHPPAPVLKDERACALLEGPTSPRDVTALAVDGYAATYEVVEEAMTYADPAPVEADAAALSRGGLVDCVRRLLGLVLGGNGLGGESLAHVTSLGEHLGDVRSVAISASWQLRAPDGSARLATDTLEFVVLLRGRAEAVILAQNEQGPVPQAVIGRVAGRLAAKLESRFPS